MHSVSIFFNLILYFILNKFKNQKQLKTVFFYIYYFYFKKKFIFFVFIYIYKKDVSL